MLWFLAPTFSILSFLLISTYHFGAADALNYGIKSEHLKHLKICSTIMGWPRHCFATIASLGNDFGIFSRAPKRPWNIVKLPYARRSCLGNNSALVVFVNLFQRKQTEKLIAILLICFQFG